ncbi:hypothetical protein BGX34_007604, partial [Mortierella sp. NVP85]
MSEAEENQDKKDDALSPGLAHTSANAKANANEDHAEQQASVRTEGHVKEDSDSQHQDHSPDTHKLTAAAAGALSGQDQDAAMDYFTHQASPKLNTTSSLVASHHDDDDDETKDFLTAAAASASHTHHTSETDQPVSSSSSSSLSSRLVPNQPSSTLTTALNRSRSNSNSHHHGELPGSADPLALATAAAAATAAGGGGATEVPDTENIDPVASYSAWRKKKDQETIQGTQAVMESFLKQHSAYDVLPVSYRQIVLDTTLLVKKALSVLMQY